MHQFAVRHGAEANPRVGEGFESARDETFY
jgi:hypothetical protein